MSDLVDNTNRGAFAEFLVAKALGIKLTSARVVWNEYDLDYKLNGINYRLQVKNSGYVQSCGMVQFLCSDLYEKRCYTLDGF